MPTIGALVVLVTRLRNFKYLYPQPLPFYHCWSWPYILFFRMSLLKLYTGRDCLFFLRLLQQLFVIRLGTYPLVFARIYVFRDLWAIVTVLKTGKAPFPFYWIHYIILYEVLPVWTLLFLKTNSLFPYCCYYCALVFMANKLRRLSPAIRKEQSLYKKLQVSTL